MPPPATADWQAVKTTAIATGSLIEAADHHGLKYDAVKQRACREKWPVGRRVLQQLAQAKDAADQQVALAAKASVTPVVTSVTSSFDALLDHLAEDAKSTRTALSKAARNGAETASGLRGSDVIKSARNIGEIGKLAALVHGWRDDSGNTGTNVNILSQVSIVQELHKDE